MQELQDIILLRKKKFLPVMEWSINSSTKPFQPKLELLLAQLALLAIAQH